MRDQDAEEAGKMQDTNNTFQFWETNFDKPIQIIDDCSSRKKVMPFYDVEHHPTLLRRLLRCKTSKLEFSSDMFFYAQRHGIPANTKLRFVDLAKLCEGASQSDRGAV